MHTSSAGILLLISRRRSSSHTPSLVSIRVVAAHKLGIWFFRCVTWEEKREGRRRHVPSSVTSWYSRGCWSGLWKKREERWGFICNRGWRRTYPFCQEVFGTCRCLCRSCVVVYVTTRHIQPAPLISFWRKRLPWSFRWGSFIFSRDTREDTVSFTIYFLILQRLLVWVVGCAEAERGRFYM